jgi:FlaA1/EpsC-like NDP-sugar epimerase
MYHLTILLVAVFLLIWRVLFDLYLPACPSMENILVIGTGEPARVMGEEILKRERLGFRLVGFVGDAMARNTHIGKTGRILGDYSQIVELTRANGIRRLVVALTERRGGYPLDSLLDLRVRGCKVTEWGSFYEQLSGRIPIDNLSPSYFIFQEGFRKSTVLLYSRRVVSLSFSAGLLLLIIP